jgi:penicillin-binding protein 1C
MSQYDDDRFDKSGPPPAMQPGGTPFTPPQAAPVHGLQYAAPPVKPPRGRFKLACLGCLLGCSSVFAIVACITLVLGVVVFSHYSGEIADKWDEQLKTVADRTFQTTIIYDRNKNELHQMFDQGRRTNVKLAEIPSYLIDATVAVEDNTFWDNPGVDWGAVARAGVQYVQAGRNMGGASTITQQLVRNIAFDYEYRTEVSVQRKAEEIIMALILTHEKSKNDIMELYLNQIYYGNLAYGIEAASQTYFGKSAKDLTLAEASLLAGLPQSPAELDPLNPDPKVQDAVFKRRKVVLDLMVEKGKITQEAASQALSQALIYANPNVNLKSPHFTLYAEQELKSLIEGLQLAPAILSTGGLKVYTTLDQNYQTIAENIARQQIVTIRDQHNAHNAAVVILKPGTGEILAMMGSVDYYADAIDGRVNVTTSLKQPGSAMKPLTYAAAMEQGLTAASVLWDVETHIALQGAEPYSPVNYDRRFHGPVRVRDALANSYNIPAVETLRQIGVEVLLSLAQRFRIHSLGTDSSRFGLSLTLGGGEVTPLELTQAYAVFANGGAIVSPTSILCVIDNSGEILYQYEHGCEGKATVKEGSKNIDAQAKQILDERIAFIISDILADNASRSVAMGSNSPLRTDNLVTSVKTGTTNDFKDNWTVGYTHNVVVGVWVGNTDSTAMVNSSGLTGAAPIWHDIIIGIYRDPKLLETLKIGGNLRSDELTPPAGLYRKQICVLSSIKDPAGTCNPGRAEWFLDSPPALPDASGTVQKGQSGQQIPPTQQPANGPIIAVIDPGVVQTLVQPLDPNLAVTLAGNRPGLPDVPPLYCLVPNEVRDQVGSASLQVFIKAPTFPDELAYARAWAQATGIAIQPDIPCTPEMLVPPPPEVPGAAAQITSPRPGQTVTGMVQVSGIANWQPGQAGFFKMEIQGPQFPYWTTFGQTHETPVINGLLDQFGAEGLQPGIYKIRVTIVSVDGGYLLNSRETLINVTGR